MRLKKKLHAHPLEHPPATYMYMHKYQDNLVSCPNSIIDLIKSIPFIVRTVKNRMLCPCTTTMYHTKKVTVVHPLWLLKWERDRDDTA